MVLTLHSQMRQSPGGEMKTVICKRAMPSAKYRGVEQW